MTDIEEKGRAASVAVASAVRHKGREIVKPTDLVMARPAPQKKGQPERRISLFAAKCFNLMVGVIQADGFQDKLYSIPKAVLRQSHKSNERLSDMRVELHSTPYLFQCTTPEGLPGTVMVPLLAATITSNDDSDESQFFFRITPELSDILRRAPYWSSLLADHVRKFDSSYAMRLYEIGCQIVGRDHAKTLKLTPEALREMLHVPAASYPDWANLRRAVIDKAINEVNQIAQTFTVAMPPELIHRGAKNRIKSLELHFEGTTPAKALLARTEVESHSSGRRARREGAVEAIVKPIEKEALDWLSLQGPSPRSQWAIRAIALGALKSKSMTSLENLGKWIGFVAEEMMALPESRRSSPASR